MSLLSLIEHEYSKELAEELDRHGVDTCAIIVHALDRGSDYWRGLALRWLMAGHPIERDLADKLEEFGRGHVGTQHDRHEAFRLAVRRKRASPPQE